MPTMCYDTYIRYATIRKLLYDSVLLVRRLLMGVPALWSLVAALTQPRWDLHTLAETPCSLYFAFCAIHMLNILWASLACCLACFVLLLRVHSLGRLASCCVISNTLFALSLLSICAFLLFSSSNTAVGVTYSVRTFLWWLAGCCFVQ